MKKKLSKRGRKILAVVLALVVACSVFPNISLFGDRSVFAAGEDEGETKPTATELTEDMFTCSSTTLEYTGGEIANPVSVASGYSLTEGTDYTCGIVWRADTASEYSVTAAIREIGYYEITMTGIGSYAGAITFDVTVAQVIDGYTLRITGSENNSLPTVEVISTDNQTLAQAGDYTVKFYLGSDEVTALQDGTYYTLAVTGTGLYTGEITKTYSQEDASADGNVPYTLTSDTGTGLFGYWYNGSVTVALESSQAESGYLLCDSSNGSADISANASAASSVVCDAEGTNYFYLTDDSNAGDQIYCYRVLVDPTAPMLNASSVNQGEWAQSKTIYINASDSTSGLYGGCVYYEAGTDVPSIDGSGTVTETQITDAVNAGTLSSAAVSQGSAEIVITDSLDETGTTYYIYAIDNAGNVTAESVVVSRIDPSAPEIIVDSDDADENGGFQDAYWKSDEALTLSFTVTDDTVSVTDESSLGSVKVQKLSGSEYVDCNRDNASVRWSSTDQKYVLTVKTEGSYRIVVTDEAGNAYTSGAFEVKQDSSAPEVAADAKNKAGYTVKDEEEKNYCFSDSLTVALTVKDEKGASDTEQSDVTVSVTAGSATTAYNLQDLLTDARVFTSVTDNEDGTWTLLYEMTETGSISFSVADEINAAAEISVSAKKYEDEPSVELDYASDSEPTQVTESGTTIDYFNSESIEDLDILANITDGSGIASIAYEITASTDESFNESGSKIYDISVYGQEDFTSFTDQSLADLSGDDDILRGLDDGSYTVTYTVTNVLGNTATASISFSVDTAAPDEDIYVTYTSDSDETDASDYYSSGLGGVVNRLIDTLKERIFGKTNVYFTLYMKDADGAVVSGIDADALIADGNIILDSDVDSGVTLTVNADSVTTAKADLTVDGAEMSGTYTMVRGVISTVSEDELDSLNHILIQSVDDMAGNSLTEIDGAAVLGTENVILDNVHPDLSVSYPAYNESDGDYYYYSPESDTQKYEEIVLTYTEKYFAEYLDENGDMVLPSIQVSMDGGESYDDVSETESAAKDVPYVKWDTTDVSGGMFTATLYLPYSTATDGGEIKYQIQTSYADGAGNVLTRIKDDGMSSIDTDTGLYQSETLVLDNDVPMLVSYEISGTTLYQVDGVDVYQNDDADDDVTLTWVMSDNDEYWDASRMTLTIRNKTTGSTSVEIYGDDASIEWDPDGKMGARLHTAVYTFDGDTDPANYDVVISYTDYAQNEMISGDEDLTVTGGSYTSDEFILDHAAPTFDITYSDASRLVSDTTGAQEDDITSESEIGSVVPTTGYTAYYNDTIRVTVKIYDDYIAMVKDTDDEITDLSQFTLLINGAEIDPQDIKWGEDKTNGCCTGEFTIPAEGDYVLALTYKDAAGNVVTVSEDNVVQGSAADLETTDFDGTYTSTKLIVDETVPVVDLAYGTYSTENGVFQETDPSAVYDGDDYSYYNEADGIWLQVSVQDENIRYAEILDYLIASLKATDINGNDITEDTAAYQYLQTMMEQNGNQKERETLTLYVPLTDDAYYDLASGTVTDLAQNVSDTVAERHICTDYTMPEDDILTEYATDIGTGFEDTFHGLALYREYLFGRQSMDVTLYIRDNLSGVQMISYQYDGAVAQTAERDGDLVDYKGDGVLYAKFTLSLPVTAYNDRDDILIDENLIVSAITDRAGNIRTENSTTAAYTGDTELIIDNVNPDVQVTYPASDDDGSYENYYFFSQEDTQSDEVVTLVYTERYFLENVETNENGYAVYIDGEMSPIYPVITVEMNGETITVSDALSDTQPYVVWGDYNTSDYTIEAQLHLPYSRDEDGAEIEYVIETEYTDGSGNVLVRNTDDSFSTIGDGVYRSGTLVLDNKAPELLSYTISGTTDREVDGVPVYKSVDGDDVTLTWVVDDNDKYWNPSDLTFTIRNVTTGEISVEISGDDAAIKWDPNGRAGERLHTGVYTFDGDADPANYYVTVSYADRAANLMISGNDDLEVESGSYQSAEFILDHTAPVFNISYTPAYRLVNDSDTAQSNDKKNAVPTTGYTAYYSTDIDVTIEITEDYAVEQTATGSDGEVYLVGLTDYTLQIAGVQTSSYTPEYTWTYNQSRKTYMMEFTLSAEDYYKLSVSYTDAAGNVMTKGSTVQGSYTSLDSADLNGSYGSTTLVIDKTAPQITGTYSSTVIDETAGRYYFNDSTTLTLTVTDSNVRDQELKDAMSADTAYMIENAGTDIFSSTSAYASLSALDGKTLHTRSGDIVYEISLSTQANYNLYITDYEDLAGNAAVITDYNPNACVDTASPTNVTFTYFVDTVGTWEAINYAKLGYAFANAKLTVRAAANDATAGLKLFTFYVTDENGTVTTIQRTHDPAASVSETITIPLTGDDFKGSVEVVVTDWSGNTNSKIEGQIVQSASRHASAGSATITTLTSPSRTVNGVDYYNTDVTFNLTLKETYAGLRSYSYTAGSLISASFDYSAQAGYDLTQSKSYEITDTFSANLTLAASANNQNDVSVEASYIDNTGYTGSVSKTYNIDITKPTIEVIYDNNSPTNETYYKDTRTATVVITERNFDADDVVFTITNTDGTMPTISGWTTSGSGDATRHTATVTFSADGDYTFTVAFQDLAGNKADYSTVDEFTIDKTIPTYTVTYDNNSYQNGYYYDANRVATIDILEHNFDASAVTITVTRDGSTITPVISGWTRSGDHNIATVSFNTDGDYTFTISGVDLAENPMDDYTMDQFVVDTEVPEIEIYNIENYSANNGVVQPGIRYSDTNYDSNATVVEMVGYYNGSVSMDGQKTITSEGVEILMDDFEYVQEMDDMYTMTATVYDLAGNSSEASVTFSVNRFGSVYTFDNATEALVGENGSYYTNEEPTIVVYETNVDTLESGEIAKNLNGDLNTLEEDEDYTVNVSGDEVSWKQYTYTLDSSNFELEGEYILTFMSQDRATNYNTNEKQIGFVVDKTAPTVLVSGITDGEQLREETHDIVISAADNVRLKYVTVINDGESAEYDSEDVTDGSFTHTLSSKDERQTLQVIATDAAGNQSTVMSIVDESGNVVEELGALTYLLTTNLWIQFISNTPLLIGVIVVIAAVVVFLLWWFLFGKKRRKKDEEDVQASA